ncbi:MAG: inorganic phosphate transporter [Firmicutes bacterium HGW-Firmicutes-7]|nr:MAG: inorganic phosphate transporter [Firmicutes bacterium HGW-Firmicutes-7]
MNPLLLAGMFLGWGLGANDSANIFGTAVYTRIVKYSTAIILTAVFVIIGAYLDGAHGIEKLSSYAFNGGIDTETKAFFVMIAAAFTVAAMTFLKLPVSTSQAVIGAIIGGGINRGTTDFSAGIQFFSAWVFTPIGAMIIANLLYKLISNRIGTRLTAYRFYEVFIRFGYIIAGIMGAYSLGANNVANVTAVFAGKLNMLNVQQAALLGGISIAFGALTFSKPVMSTVGQGIVPLSKVAGFIVVISVAITVYIYALIGIPVSTSQAVVGAIIGIGFQLGIKTINLKLLRNILFGWVGTPLVAGVFSFLLSLFI